jgi:hypothetical protein
MYQSDDTILQYRPQSLHCHKLLLHRLKIMLNSFKKKDHVKSMEIKGA